MDTKQALGDLTKIVSNLESANKEEQLDAVMMIKKLLLVDEVINCGAVPRLVKLLHKNDDPALQHEGCWCLCNIAAGAEYEEDINSIIDAGCVPLIINLLSSPNKDLREQAVRAIGNIAGSTTRNRDFVLKSGALQPIIQLISNNPKSSLLENAMCTLTNMLSEEPSPDSSFMLMAIPILSQLLHHDDDDILSDAISLLSDASEGPDENIDAIIKTGCLKRIVELLKHPKISIITSALKIIGNLVSGDDILTQKVLDCGIFKPLRRLLSRNKKGIRCEVCWIISNITAGNINQKQSVIDEGLIPQIIQLSMKSVSKLQKESICVLYNLICDATMDQIKYLVDEGVIPVFCRAFSNKDPKVITMALEAIKIILRCGEKEQSGYNEYLEFIEKAGAIEKLDVLKSNPQDNISQKALEILTNFIYARR